MNSKWVNMGRISNDIRKKENESICANLKYLYLPNSYLKNYYFLIGHIKNNKHMQACTHPVNLNILRKQ
jgi:hypothetical protein